MPYGVARNVSGALPTYRYTGQQEVSGIELYDYDARWYDAAIEWQIRLDPTVPDATNPQSHNRFSYVRNNSLSFVAPFSLSESEVDEYYESDWLWKNR